MYGLRKLVFAVFVVSVAASLNTRGHMEGSIAAQLIGAATLGYLGANAAGKFGNKEPTNGNG